MSVKIGSNIAALQAQRRLGVSSRELGDVFQRLASGQRINKASDDAAGLAIADRLRADRRLYTQSVANMNDGISTISILDGALEQRGGILQRLSELAEQASNGSLSNTQRGSLGKEYREMLQELARIKESTTFNGLDLFNSSTSLAIQAGINGGSNSRITFDGVDLGNMQWTLNTSDLLDLADFDGNGGVDGADASEFYTYQGNSSLAALKAKFGDNWTTTTVVDRNGVNRTVFIAAVAVNDQAAFLTYTQSENGNYFVGAEENLTQWGIATEIGGSAMPSSPPTSDIVLGDGLGGTFTLDHRLIRISDSQAISPAELMISSVDSISTARASLDLIKAELDTLAKQRGKIGASESRLQVALNLSTVAGQNAAQAESRIRDADIAQESANLVRLQILQNIGATIMRNSGLQPEIALRLLQS